MPKSHMSLPMFSRRSPDHLNRFRRLARFAGLLLIVCFVLAGCAQFSASPATEEGSAQENNGGTPVDPPKQLTNFTLTSQTGAPLRLSDLRGRAVLLFFGYTHCPDVCPTTLAEWKRIKATLGDAAKQVAFVFVSVDNERDQPAVLKKFLASFDPSFIGLTGDPATIAAIGKDYGLYLKSHADAGNAEYVVDHSPYSYLIDQDGGLRMIYSADVPESAISAGIKKMLSQS
jgi:protein SCO1/2